MLIVSKNEFNFDVFRHAVLWGSSWLEQLRVGWADFGSQLQDTVHHGMESRGQSMRHLSHCPVSQSRWRQWCTLEFSNPASALLLSPASLPTGWCPPQWGGASRFNEPNLGNPSEPCPQAGFHTILDPVRLTVLTITQLFHSRNSATLWTVFPFLYFFSIFL